MKTSLRNVIARGPDGNDIRYQALMFACPGCAELHGNDGIHMLPVNSSNKSPSWTWDGNLDAPTLSPSILTGRGDDRGQCHSFLRAGIFEFLADSTHSFAGQNVPMPDLPAWTERSA